MELPKMKNIGLSWLLSFLWPVVIEEAKSEASGRLEVSLENGRKVLNAPHSNYSYGRLHKVFQAALQHFEFPAAALSPTLILGYGGGSLASILNNEYYHQGPITGVELDPQVIDLAQRHFPSSFERVELEVCDAWEYLFECQQHFQHIFIDLFVDDMVPPSVRSERFVNLVADRLGPQGVVYHNLMLGPKQEAMLLAVYKSVFEDCELFRGEGRNAVISARNRREESGHKDP